jgi:GNAT superfamily N-acetyltransferase
VSDSAPAPHAVADGLEFAYVSTEDPRARVLLDDLEREYDTRYEDLQTEPAAAEINHYPAERFLPPDGAFVVLLRAGEPVAGGAFMRFDHETAEFKRIWTHAAHRRTGLSRRVLAELEAEAVRRGYARVFLTTGPRQPEAVGLYRSSGYRDVPWPDDGRDDGVEGYAFEKDLDAAP